MEYIIGGNSYNGICPITTSKNKYLILFDGKKVDFIRETANGYFLNNSGKFHPKALTDPAYLNLISEDIILNELTNKLTTLYGNLEYNDAVNAITTYVSYADAEISNLITNFTINNDPSKPLEEQEANFRTECINIFNQLDMLVSAKLNANDKNIGTEVVEDSVLNTNIEVTTPKLNAEEIIQSLSMADLNEVTFQIQSNPGRDALEVIVDTLAKKPEIQKLMADGYTKEDAIKYNIIDGNHVTLNDGLSNSNTMEHAKVKVLTTNAGKPMHSTEGGYIDMIILAIFAQLTIFAILVGILNAI